MENRVYFRIKTALSIISVILFATLLVWFSAGMINAGRTSEVQQKDNVRQTVINGAVLCYSVEGFYPDSLDYLEENYGLKYDKNKYTVHYKYVSADVRPAVNIIVRN